MQELAKDVYLVKPGEIERDGDLIKFASSAVVLYDGDPPVVIDTGLREEWEKIRSGIEEVMPIEGVGAVINTHLHIDHIGCNPFFNAQVYGPEEDRFRKDARELDIGGLSIMDTPGHMWAHIAVVLETSETVVVAGDALPTRGNYEDWVPPNIHVDREKAMDSMQRIVDAADIIVPGHESPFRPK